MILPTTTYEIAANNIAHKNEEHGNCVGMIKIHVNYRGSPKLSHLKCKNCNRNFPKTHEEISKIIDKFVKETWK